MAKVYESKRLLSLKPIILNNDIFFQVDTLTGKTYASGEKFQRL